MIDENKLIDELNKKSKEFDNECSYFLNKCEFQEAYRCAGKTLGIVAAMEIVNEQEKIEFSFSRMENEWIPISERLPESDGFYLATLDGEIVGEDRPFTGLAEFKDGKWIDDEEDYKCVIAWQSLPEPYKGE